MPGLPSEVAGLSVDRPAGTYLVVTLQGMGVMVPVEKSAFNQEVWSIPDPDSLLPLSFLLSLHHKLKTYNILMWNFSWNKILRAALALAGIPLQ